MTEDADKALPGAALFFAQGATEIGQHQQLMRQTVFAKCASPHTPASGSAGKRQRQRLVFIDIVTSGQSEIIRVSA